MLDDRRDSGVTQTEGDCLGQSADQSRIGGKSAVADDGVSLRQQQIGDRGAGHVDAEIGQHSSDYPPKRTRRGKPRLQIAFRQQPDRALRRQDRPVWWAKPGHTTALLIDQDGRVSPYRATQFDNQRTGLRGIGYIALEQDEAVRIGIGEESPLAGSQRRSGAAENDRARMPARKGGGDGGLSA
jgi:hypothetical protein